MHTKSWKFLRRKGSQKIRQIKGENDYEKVGRFVEENRCSDFFVAGGKGYYTAVNIRAHIMNNQE